MGKKDAFQNTISTPVQKQPKQWTQNNAISDIKYILFQMLEQTPNLTVHDDCLMWVVQKNKK